MPEVSPLQPTDPDVLAGYRLTGRLGEGGQGTVFLAHAPDGDKVAVKVLHSQFGVDKTARARFVREVAAAQRVASFCTARVLAADVDGDVPYLVSEFVDGPSLQDHVRRDGPLTGTDLERLAVGTITALVAVHQSGIVHRDFKPSNVLLPHTGPRVVDFGIARALDATSTLTSQVIGTPAYMAPEQLAESPIGPPVDMFAWGCTMVFAATSVPPFGNDAVPAIIARILREEPNLDGLSGPLRDIVADCLNKDPDARPATVDVLTRLLGGAVKLPEVATWADGATEAVTLADRTTPAPHAEIGRQVTVVPPGFATAPPPGLPPPGAFGAAGLPGPPGAPPPGFPLNAPPHQVRPLSPNGRLAIGAAATVLGLVGLIAVVVLALPGGHGKTRDAGVGTSAGPVPPGAANSPVPPTSPTPESSPSTPRVRGSVDLNKVMPSEFEGFNKVASRAVGCAGEVSAAAKKALRDHPCQAPITEALYLNTARTIKITVAVLTFSDETAATAVETAAKAAKDFPVELYPVPTGSNLPKFKSSSAAGGWTYHTSGYQYLTYAESYQAEGGDAGPQGGAVDRAAHDMGVEVANAIIWA